MKKSKKVSKKNIKELEVKEHKKEVVPEKLGQLTLKKNKSGNYNILNKDKKLLAELNPPVQVGNYYLPCWAIWRETIEKKNVLDEVFATLDSALVYIQKKYSRKVSRPQLKK